MNWLSRTDGNNFLLSLLYISAFIITLTFPNNVLAQGSCQCGATAPGSCYPISTNGSTGCDSGYYASCSTCSVQEGAQCKCLPNTADTNPNCGGDSEDCCPGETCDNESLSCTPLANYKKCLTKEEIAAQPGNPQSGCTTTGNDEFHSLRPYPGKPCNTQIKDTARFCANDLFLTYDITVNPSGATACRNIGNNKQECDFVVNDSRRVEINLSGAELPIMGNTEDVVNRTSEAENLSDPEKVNNYVSWYLNGINNRAESPYLSIENKEDVSKIIDYSGPLNKLLPQEIQYRSRIATIQKAKVTRHDQIVACINFFGVPVPCKQTFLSFITDKITPPLRLSDWENRRISLWPTLPSTWQKTTPPFSQDFSDYLDYLKAYKEWRGNSCIMFTVPIINKKVLLCGDNITRPNYWSNLFPYIPFSSTEDRTGLVYTSTPSVTSSEGGMKISDINFTNQTPVELFFPHMEETAELSELLQQTYASKGTTDDLTLDSSVIHNGSNHCDLAEIRSNPGDKIVLDNTKNIISGDLSFKADFSCEFPLASNPQPVYAERCDNVFGGACVPDNWTCTGIKRSGYGCPSNLKCGVDCNPPEQPPSECKKTINVNLSLTTETPLVDEAWARTVAGNQSVFKRIFPKVGEGGPILSLIDIPGATKVSYVSTDGTSVVAGNPGTERDGQSAELYIPHVGGISEYFLKGIQTMLRPKGYGEQIVSGDKPGVPVSAGSCGQIAPPTNFQTAPHCETGIGYCDPSILAPYFGGDMQKAQKASIICNAESGGNPNNINCGCMTGASVDYSIGLFQINLLAHCPGAFSGYTWHPPSCTIGEQETLNTCQSTFLDPVENIQKMVGLSANGTSWAPWSVYTLPNAKGGCKEQIDAI